MTLAGALAGGFVGTVVLASSLQLATGLRLTRIDLPFMLGSLITEERSTAKGAGYAIQAVVGLGFAVIYWGLFQAAESNAWWLGTVLGVLHGLVTATVLVPMLLPAVHPRLGSSQSAAPEAPVLGQPGFLMLAYGAATPAVTIAAHTAYGTLVAVFSAAGG